ncbi:MAG: SpoIID/LytB domain-containing protein [Candidatus Eisenbacteria bacterium]|uniref:SpoIID/LytB domain-containing protein n=1 Tax=Eiseniibacteriota bacterium TaxID=2212470 RepID=A0A538TTS2_UNCEI|nr:MAG: SpoIID/LytB domain-containing protein [Candidatus Eisenbacteria bacterium]
MFARVSAVIRAAFLTLVVSVTSSGCGGTWKELPPTTGVPPPPSQPPANAPTPLPPGSAWRSVKSIQIGLTVGAARLLVAGSKEWQLSAYRGQDVAPSAIAMEEAGARLQIARIEAGVIEVFREGEPAPIWSGTPADTLLLRPVATGYSGWGGKWYRGSFKIFTSQPNGLTLVNQVDIESYLRSVLPHEIGTPPESDFEAVKAQAVAARSYTLSYLGRRAALGFDLYASVEDQVYGGIGLENAQSERALDATQGEILLSDGAPIRALYSSACGGRTANVEDVWPWSRTPYLRSVLDADDENSTPYCSISANFRWREEWDPIQFMATIRQYGPAEGGALAALAGDLVDVTVKSRGRSGRVQELVVRTTMGDWTLHGDRTRWGLRRPGQAAILRSSFFKIGVERDGDGKPLKVVATGAGNGHGIGLCQWGAMGMARSGKGYRDILAHYYKSTSLARVD